MAPCLLSCGDVERTPGDQREHNCDNVGAQSEAGTEEKALGTEKEEALGLEGRGESGALGSGEQGLCFLQNPPGVWECGTASTDINQIFLWLHLHTYFPTFSNSREG